jgi:hypothetical protein
MHNFWLISESIKRQHSIRALANGPIIAVFGKVDSAYKGDVIVQ